MKVCYTALISNYEELKEPKVITPGWEYICLTDQPLESKVWNIVRINTLETDTPQRLARWYKIMHWVDWEQSMWVDASFVIDTDLNEWWNNHFHKGFSAAKHPLRNCVYNEGLDCIISKRGDRLEIEKQIAEYKILQIPKGNGVITSGILLRENTPEVIALCEEWWAQVAKHSTRDQIAFAKASLNKTCVHTYNWDYRQGRDFIYKHHYNRR